jgi:hypothetical protein
MTKVAIGAAMVVTTLALPLSLSAPAGATSAFCSTLETWATHPPKSAPTSYSVAAYHAWANTVIPIYEKLASEAPNAQTKDLFNEVVAILKAYDGAKSISSLKATAVADSAKFKNDAKALEQAVLTCLP